MLLRTHFIRAIVFSLLSMPCWAETQSLDQKLKASAKENHNFFFLDDSKTENENPEASKRMIIPFQLIKYKKISRSNPQGKVSLQIAADTPIDLSFNALMIKPNQYDLSPYHFETVPLYWDRKNNDYKMKINVYRKESRDQVIEESLGFFTVFGKVSYEKNSSAQLIGAFSHTFYNKFGEPILSLQSKIKPNQNNLSQKNGTQKRLSN